MFHSEQVRLASFLQLEDDIDWDKDLKYVGGVDVSFCADDTSVGYAGLVVFSYPSMEIVYEDYKQIKVEVEYIPGFLAFREVEPLCELIETCRQTRFDIFPQLVFVDGNGRLHIREFGSACHLGVLGILIPSCMYVYIINSQFFFCL